VVDGGFGGGVGLVGGGFGVACGFFLLLAANDGDEDSERND